MESSLAIAILAVVFLAGVTTAQKCDTVRLGQCMELMQSGDIESFCRSVDAIKQCFEEAKTGCPVNQVNQAMASFNGIAAQCSTDAGSCSMTQMQTCLKDMPQSAQSNPSIEDVKAMCKNMGKAKVCLETLVTSCEDPNMRNAVSSTLAGLKQNQQQCKDMMSRGPPQNTDESAGDAEPQPEGEGAPGKGGEGGAGDASVKDKGVSYEKEGDKPENTASGLHMSLLALALSSLLVLPAWL